jgi:hypothetical protein
VSGFAAARRLEMARALWFDLPQTYRLLEAGEISDYVASLVVTETRHLDAATRRDVDGKIVAAGIAHMGPRRAAACAKGHAYEADPHGYVERGSTERKHRRVSLRPAPGLDRTPDRARRCPGRVSEQPAALNARSARSEHSERSNQCAANNHKSAELAGYGPLPAGLARDLLATSKSRLWWRRLYALPFGGPLAGGDPHRRNFDGYLRKLIIWRDQECRDAYCEAPIRHIDHIRRYTDGGPHHLLQWPRRV